MSAACDLKIIYTRLVFARRVIPESVRWLITAGKINEASEELKCIAKHNGKKLSDDSLKKLETLKNANDKVNSLVNTINL